MDAPASDSVGADAILQPQGTKSVQNVSFLSLVDPYTFFSPAETSTTNIAPSGEPTSEQVQAIATLRKYNNRDIVAWHTLSRSLESGLRYQGSAGDLSHREVLAISTLRSCTSKNLKHWLESENQRFSPGVGYSTPDPIPFSRQVQRSSLQFDHPSLYSSSFQSVKASSPYLSSNPYSVLKAADKRLDVHQTHQKETTDGKPTLVEPAIPDHRYWCTICDGRSFKQSDSWKKHEKEHEIKYVCMLNGLFEPTNDGRRCVLCGALDQLDDHGLVHSISACIEAAERPSFKRRYDMVKHLKDDHNVLDTEHIGITADKWRCRSSNKAWSCGFCINLSGSLQDHLKHIGTEHFEKGQSIRHWSHSNVIQGLLMQPRIKEAWNDLSESLGLSRYSDIRWNKIGSEDLLRKLQKGLTGGETPQSLATASYDSAEFDWNLSDDDVKTHNASSDTVANHISHGSMPRPFSDDTSAVEELPVERQPWSHSTNQTSQISLSPSYSETPTAYGLPDSHSSPVHLHPNHPNFDQSTELDPLTSDIGDMSSTQPTTPFNDHNLSSAEPSIYTDWNAYGFTPDPTDADHQKQHNPISNNKVWWHVHLKSDADDHPDKTPTTLKRQRESVSPPTQHLPRKHLRPEEPRKKKHRRNPE